MPSSRAPELNPALLPPGTVVGSWRVAAWAGRGVHGTVYRAVPVTDEHAEPTALKLALLPRDPRFAREVELLSRVRHACIPRLRDSGIWQHPGGTLHPFFVMDWVDGTPLYEWAQQHTPSSQHVLRLLAQLARALQAVHAQGCLHRDVKGDNILVRHSDGSALLTDFGSGRFPDAATLTPGTLPPGTPAYRSPEACLFELQFFRDPRAHYAAQPADDLYALGVTAYRLVTGEYPEFGDPIRDASGTWHLEGLVSAAPLALNPSLDPQLNVLILRMLSMRPEQRGTAAELASALEQAAQGSSPESTPSCFVPETLRTANTQSAAASTPTPSAAAHVRPPTRAQPWQGLFAAAAALGVWIIWVCGSTPLNSPELPTAVRHEADAAGLEDGGTAGLGDEAVASSVAPSVPSVSGEPAESPLPEPMPGQTRPNAKGKCAHPRQIPLNGGCWVKTSVDREGCEVLTGTMIEGTCYLPVPLPKRQPTSYPVHTP
ncbi:serine/threonine protein kinase [Stigmatella aurantiaca]|uniref:non-specific serine/threonine protein kinase n=1 Tax=Stigmatella aurantiaca (strain DW4/3-1) TaxID=378806 RepID=Q09EC9_STIAD|nr:serine/threonine-protein kinase [Stigmatella aurantiaca]ADO74663.1 Protein kinase [Stigmatella aurantiaca DW4/3-1]EAU70016.1 protein kinase [Stigmatella aurantiaca DW4/3-1]